MYRSSDGKRGIAVLGSTGSIGRQTLEVMERLNLRAVSLTGHRNLDLLEQQARQFCPEVVAVPGPSAASDLRLRLADTDVRVVSGQDGLCEAVSLDSVETVVTALVGIAGLVPTLAAVRAGKRIALANKETLVCAGELVMEEAGVYGAEILPVDSEHSAIFQCLEGNRDRGAVRRLILTASGGPFYGMDTQGLSLVTREQALRHPNWTMGAKITVDSATLMNKGLELIEAMRLYHMPMSQIDVVVHRESIIHSLVEYCDGAMLAQMGMPDMRLPIQYALTWPRRLPGGGDSLDLLSCPPLTFGTPDEETFRCLKLARRAAEAGGTATAALNGANEAAVSLFLEGAIGFCAIAELVEAALERVPVVQKPDLAAVLEADCAAREIVCEVNQRL